MNKKKNKFIVVAHDLQSLAAVLRIKSSTAREAIALKENNKNQITKATQPKVKNKHSLLCASVRVCV